MRKIHPHSKILEEQNLAIFPLKYKTKEPAVNELAPILQNGYDGKVYDDQNIGVVCGKVSGNLFCADIERQKRNSEDKKHYSVETSLLDKILPDCLNQTLTDKTGTDGFHLFLRVDNLPPKTTKLFCPIDDEWEYVIDLKVTGYVVGAGSINEDGNQYSTISSTNVVKHVDFQYILANLEKAGFAPKTNTSSQIDSDQNNWAYEELLDGKYPIGERRRKQNSLYVKLRRRQKSPEEAQKIIYDINEKLSQPLSNDEVKTNLDHSESFFINEVFPKWGYCEDSNIYELRKLSEIDSPKHANKIVSVKAVVSSNAISYNVPCEIGAVCGNNNHNCIGKTIIPVEINKQVKFVETSETARHKILKSIAQSHFTSDCNISIKETKSTTLKKIRIKSIVSSLIKKDSEFFDDSGNQWVAYDVFLIHNDIDLEAGKEVKVTGIVTSDPKSAKVTMIISEISFIDSNEFDIQKIRELHTFHKTMSVQQSMEWYEKEFEKYSGIIKRYNITKLGLMSMCCPLYIPFEGKKIPSWIKSTIIGDSTTAKSETMRKLIILMKIGQIISGEMSSIAGLAGASVQATGGQWFTDFGILPLNDKKFLAIDGAHILKKEELSKLAESERNGKIEITKASKGEAYARTRQCKIMNPLDGDQINTVSMDSFLYPVQSLQNNFQLQNISRIDLACFVSNDIPPEDRNKPIDGTYDYRLEYLSDLVRLVWAQNYIVEFTEETMQEILKQSTLLENKFQCDEFPLITNDQKTKLAKLSASVACLTISFNDTLDKLTVLPEHVRYISEIIQYEYTKAGLDKLSKKSHFGNISDLVLNDIVEQIKRKIVDYTTQEILEVLVWIAESGQFTNEEIGDQFGLSRDSQTRPMISILKNERVIKNGRNNLVITKKGVQIAKFIDNPSRPSNPENDTPLKKIKKIEGVSILERLGRLERLKNKSYQCKNCNSTWNATKTLSEIEQEHQKDNPKHEIQQINQLCNQCCLALKDCVCP